MHNLTAYLEEKRQRIEDALEQYLPAADTYPAVIHEAMRYSVFAGGKRLRPVLLLMTAEMFGKDPTSMLFAAAAIEMLHTYSLIHDDLPAMDNDDLRRGRPTSHKVYGEDIAILAGDALLTRAFETMCHPDHTAGCSPASILAATHELAAAAGSRGMVGGQVLDMQAERRQITAEELDYIHQHKTAKLLTAALRMGAILSEAGPPQLEAVTEYGTSIGLAFQIVDDILDIEGNSEELGKNTHSDREHHKATYPSLHGLEHSKTLTQELIQRAKISLHLFGEQASPFFSLADFIGSRTH